MTTAKPFTIPKRLVYEAFEAVKANAGSAGVDNETIEDFETNLKDNLYRIWNRMSSGSYVPPPVKAVAIPKKTGGERILGVPTVADRVAQMVVKQVLSVQPRATMTGISSSPSSLAAMTRPWPAIRPPCSSTRTGTVQPHSRIDAAIWSTCSGECVRGLRA